MMFRSNKTLCELYESRLSNSESNISRELALGEDEIANNIFLEIVQSLQKVSSRVSLNLIKGEFLGAKKLCSPGIFFSSVQSPLRFSNKEIGGIQGEMVSVDVKYIVWSTFLTAFFLIIIYLKIKRIAVNKIKNQLVDPILALHRQEIITIDSLPLEVKDISDQLMNLKKEIVSQEKTRMEIENAKKISELAVQVAHDIRSPLEVFKIIKLELDNIPDGAKERLQLAIERMEEVSFNLLRKRNQDSSFVVENSPAELVHLLDSVVSEKKIEYRDKTNVEIVSLANMYSSKLFSSVNRNHLKSILSNLINNSVESKFVKELTVKVNVESVDNYNIITVTDNGPGMSPQIMAQISHKGFTTKELGNGIGLYNARKDLENMNGFLKIESNLGAGTKASIILPAIKQNAFKAESSVIVLIDDDKLIRFSWEKFFKENSIDLYCYKSIDEFLVSKNNAINLNSPIFIDSNLGGLIRGEVESEKLFFKGYKNLFIATYYDTHHIVKPSWIKGVLFKDPSNAKEIVMA